MTLEEIISKVETLYPEHSWLIRQFPQGQTPGMEYFANIITKDPIPNPMTKDERDIYIRAGKLSPAHGSTPAEALEKSLNQAIYIPVAVPAPTTLNPQEIYNQANREYLSASGELSTALAKFNTAKLRLELIISTWRTFPK